PMSFTFVLIHNSEPEPEPAPSPALPLPSHGSPEDRGRADAYYWRSPAPHYYDAQEGRVERPGMTPAQIAAYLKGYRSETDRKDWGAY
ncbi:MAG: hypothetical protein P1V51_20195, partial [Deltaproteobacteria bacterium]|nr:hypothetical protein [Deltaproteobacteria bacterium]